MKKLNLGCGEDYKKGYINLDFRDNIKIDVKHNLEKFPYPFEKNEFDEILLRNVLEHLNNPLNALKELIRISKKNAKIKIIVPHAKSYGYISNLTHKNLFSENSFSKGLLKEYQLEKLKLIDKKFIYNNHSWKKLIPFKNVLKIFLSGIYDDLLFEFKVIKN